MTDDVRVKRQTWWALVRSAGALPILYASRADAISDKNIDEHLVVVQVCDARFPQWDRIERRKKSRNEYGWRRQTARNDAAKNSRAPRK